MRKFSWGNSRGFLSAALALPGILAVALLVPSCGGGHRSNAGNSPPFAVSFRSPAPGATNVSRTAQIFVALDRPANGLSINSGTFLISTAGATLQSAVTFQECNRVAVLTPHATLLPDTPYLVALGPGIVDAAGNPLTPDVFSFTTGPFVDVTRPTFAGATGVSAVGSSAVVTWAPASDDSDAPSQIVYDVFVSTMSGCFNFGNPSLTTSPGVTQATLSDVPLDVPAFFVVRARDRAGNSDLNTEQVSLGGGGATAVSFSNQVWPVIRDHCGECHTIGTGAQQVPSMIFSSASETFLSWVNVNATCPSLTPGTLRVRPGSSATSFVWQKVNMSAPPCGSRMPLFAPPLPTSDLEVIRAWIDEGAPNN